MVIVITGATGLLGRNILFEYIKEHRRRLDTLTVFVLGRAQNGRAFADRMREIILTDGLAYLSADEPTADAVRAFCGTGLRCIDASLDLERLGIPAAGVTALKARPIDHFFHAAALTDLRSGAAVTDHLARVNVQGTATVLQLAATLPVREFCHISTAYVCGRKKGVVLPGHLDPDADFRNPYEMTKTRAELLVRAYAAKTGTRCRTFRPSVLCGRLMEQPRGAVVKFDVFYGWAAFFLAMKLRKLGSREERYARPVTLPMRLCYAPRECLNIVPADYAAKAIFRICSEDHPGSHYHLANAAGTPHELSVGTLLASIAVSGTRRVDTVPKDPTPLERLYYRTAGAMFTPYMTGGWPRFDVEETEAIMRRHRLSCPPVDATTFPALLDYAKRFDYGLGETGNRAGSYPATASRRGRISHPTSRTAG